MSLSDDEVKHKDIQYMQPVNIPAVINVKLAYSHNVCCEYMDGNGKLIIVELVTSSRNQCFLSLWTLGSQGKFQAETKISETFVHGWQEEKNAKFQAKLSNCTMSVTQTMTETAEAL